MRLRFALGLSLAVLLLELAGGLLSHSLALLSDAGHVLVVVVLAIGVEAVRRLLAPEPVQGGLVIATALGAIGINAFVILALRGDSHNLNLRAALLHVTGDVAASAGVVVAGVVILLTG